jgi:coenzyme F420-0:L-glutamate ligase/coenzyme F420-1:gamma-L-glutamate ligase
LRAARELACARRHDRGHPQREQALQGARRHQVHGSALSRELRIIPVTGLPEIEAEEDLAVLIAAKVELEDGDVVVLAQKIVSKAEGRVVHLADVVPSAEAIEIAGDGDARRIEVILQEAARVVRVRPPLVIAETTHGFIAASAGVDTSNAPAPDMLVLLPVDPDASAAQIRERFRELTGKTVGVLITDSFGRPWRQGTIDVALGAAGIEVLRDLRGTRDRVGYELHATMIAIGDEIASAAELVMGKTDGIPAAVIRGLEVAGTGSAHDLVIPEGRDLFR